MTDDLAERMKTPEYQAKVRVLRRVAIAVSIVVGLIFSVTATLGYYYFKYDRPVKYVVDPALDPANAQNVERNAPPPTSEAP